jgi:hypothetical protein
VTRASVKLILTVTSTPDSGKILSKADKIRADNRALYIASWPLTVWLAHQVEPHRPAPWTNPSRELTGSGKVLRRV